MPETIIRAEGLGKFYKNAVALEDFTCSIFRGDIVGVVGKNGAGKTTLIRLLGGMAVPTTGTVELFGEKDPKKQMALRKKMTVMVEYPALYMGLTARDNMKMRCIMEGMPSKGLEGYIRDQLDFVGLFGAYNDPRRVRSYSMGMRQRLSIAMALITKPEIMILDEPTNGLDPDGIRQIRDLLFSLNKEHGVTIIISSHILGELSKLATRYVFIDRGHLLEERDAESLERKSGKTLTLRTNDNPRALQVLKSGGFRAEMEGQDIVVSEVKEPAIAINLLVAHKIELVSLNESENTLEDYYISLLGGRHA